MRQATSVSRDTLLSLGTCFGKFTKSGKFRLHITALDYISQYAKVCYRCFVHAKGCTCVVCRVQCSAVPSVWSGEQTVLLMM